MLVCVFGTLYSLRFIPFFVPPSAVPGGASCPTDRGNRAAKPPTSPPECIDTPLCPAGAAKACRTWALFSPRDDIKSVSLGFVESEQKKIQLAAFRLTDKDLVRALIRAHERGVSVEVIVDTANLDTRISRSVFDLLDAGIAVYVYPDPLIIKEHYSLMHNKFIVCHASSWAKGGKIVWTGSRNCTEASCKHRENVLIVCSDDIADLYAKEFERVKGESKSLRYGDRPLVRS